MPLTQGCILIGIQAAHENVTLLVLLVFFFFNTSDAASLITVEPLLPVWCDLSVENLPIFKYKWVNWLLVPLPIIAKSLWSLKVWEDELFNLYFELQYVYLASQSDWPTEKMRVCQTWHERCVFAWFTVLKLDLSGVAMMQSPTLQLRRGTCSKYLHPSPWQRTSNWSSFCNRELEHPAGYKTHSCELSKGFMNSLRINPTGNQWSRGWEEAGRSGQGGFGLCSSLKWTLHLLLWTCITDEIRIRLGKHRQDLQGNAHRSVF